MYAEALMFEIDLIGEKRHMFAREKATDAIEAACAHFEFESFDIQRDKE